MRNTILSWLACFLLALLGACSHPTGLPVLSAGWNSTALPGIGNLDALRTTSSPQVPIDVTQPVAELNTTIVGANLGLTPPAGQIAFAIFRILPPVETFVSITAGGADGLYLLVADYSADHWAGATELTGGFAVDTLSSLGGPLSPDGYIYCAVVAPPGTQGQLSSLALNYNGPANIYYVATPADGGDDANPGTSAEPWATLQHAADGIGADSLVIVRPGTYIAFTLNVSGTSTAPIIFKALPGAIIRDFTPDVAGIELTAVNWVTIDGFEIQGTAYGIRHQAGFEKAQHLVLRNNSLMACQYAGIRLAFADYALIEGNLCVNTYLEGSGMGIQVGWDSDHAIIRHNTCFGNRICGIVLLNRTVEGGDGSLTDELIEGNICYANLDPTGFGIGCEGMSASTIRNNLLYNNASGLVLKTTLGAGSVNNTIANNTIVQGISGADYGACVALQDLCTGNKLYNNILFNGEDGPPVLSINTPSLSGFESDYNIVTDSFLLDGTSQTLAQWTGVTLRDAHSLVSTPVLTFVDPVSPDYHLLATASAVGAALVDFMPVDDLDGVARPQGGASDCGCYEYVP